LWTGQDLILPPGDIYCGSCSHPPGENLHGYLVNPATSDSQPLPHGPLDDYRASYLWTGNALLAYNTTTYSGGGGKTHLPGEAAAWDPASDAWTVLPGAALASDDVAAVWTGSSVIEWGTMFTRDQANGGSVTTRTAGLQFGPP
jgi:hypothetical protein